jgi:hypothetical protein
MKTFVLVALAMLGSIPALAQDQSSCKAYFQVLRADAETPGLRTGLNPAQKRWWESKGQKKYPGLCLNGSEMSGDKPRFLVIWSKSKTIGPASLPPNEVYGQTGSALQATAPATAIYQPRWDKASVTILNVLYDGSLMLPPVYFEAGDHSWVLFPDSTKAFESAVQYLSQEQVFPFRAF